MKNSAFVLFAAFCCQGAEVKLPPPFATPSSTNRPRVIPQPEGSQLHVPTGFTTELFAEGFEQPRYMTLGPSQEILLSDSKGGTVYILKPHRKKLIEKLDRPYGLAFWKDYLYVAETTSVKRYKYDAKQMTVGAGQEVVNMKDYGKGHWTRAVLFDRAGQKMYVGVGSSSNVDAGDPEMRAAINRFNPDGSGHEIFASGTRNPTAIHFYPSSDTLWASIQERDLLGDDLVPDYFTHIQQGGFYGWPYAYIGPNEDPRRKGERPDLVKKTIVPDVVLGAHVAVIDFEFYTGKMFPQKYQGAIFVARHGPWNRTQKYAADVVAVFLNPNGTVKSMEPFLTGLVENNAYLGRPVDVLVLKDGSLLVSDDHAGAVYRVSYKK
jgi:glucose/arabinose dehydrogenase